MTVRNAMRPMRNLHLGVVLLAFLLCIALNYPEQVPFWGGPGISLLLGLTSFTVERLLFLFPVIYGALFLGMKGGVVSLAAALAAMLPGVFVSVNLPDAFFETGLVLAVGVAANWWIETRRRDAGQREQVVLKLEAVRRELQSYIEAIKENERRLSALHAISTAVNRSLVLKEVADAAADKIMEVVDGDAVVIFVVNKGTGELELKAHRGISRESASGGGRLKVGEGFNGWVAQTGEPLYVEDSLVDSRMSRAEVVYEELRSMYVVPLKSRDEVVGTLCVGVRRVREFRSEEKELLELIGIDLGVAIEKARLYNESQVAMRGFQELFEKALDAILIQNLEGRIVDLNQAAVELSGYSREEVLGRDISQFLTPQALDKAREVRQKLILGQTVKQPYEQRLTTKDGREMVLMLTTSLLGGKETPQGFQNIARDITQARQLQEDLRLYIHQITRAHEEERNRIARELHDDSIQAMVAISQRLDSLATRNNGVPGEVLKSMEGLKRDVDATLAGIRRLTQDLRPPTLDYLGLFPALRQLVGQAREEFKLDATLRVEGNTRTFEKQEELLIYRVIQEALRNVWKHAEATKVDVVVELSDDKTTITVSDNGKGFQVMGDHELAKSGTLGLIGMMERARLLGGTLGIRSRRGSGTTVTLDIPGGNRAAAATTGPFTSSP